MSEIENENKISEKKIKLENKKKRTQLTEIECFRLVLVLSPQEKVN